jgi:methionyl-tRNA formyltransferase
LKIIFAGTPEFAAKSLEAIINQGHEVIAVYTQPDRPAGRGKKLVKSDVKVVAETHDIPVFQPEKLTNADAQAELSALDPDLMIVAAYGLLLPKEVLESPTYGCINIHASLLPRWRGAAPIQRAIQAGDSETGITIMQMDEGLDTGDMILKLSTAITEEDTGGTLHDRLAEQGAEAILKYLAEREELGAEAQDSSLANYAHKLSKQEACINWQDSAEQICRDIRAFNPWPVSFFEFIDSKEKVQRVRVFEATQQASDNTKAPGTILEKNKHGILVQCSEGAISIQKLQLPGAKAIDVQSFVNGGKDILNAGDSLNAAPEEKA